jgi:hypothetical protein
MDFASVRVCRAGAAIVKGMFRKNKGLPSFLVPCVEKLGKTSHIGEFKSHF